MYLQMKDFPENDKVQFYKKTPKNAMTQKYLHNSAHCFKGQGRQQNRAKFFVSLYFQVFSYKKWTLKDLQEIDFDHCVAFCYSIRHGFALKAKKS